MAATTINGYLTRLSTLFRWAVREQYVGSNPAEQMQVTEEGPASRDNRRPFSATQLFHRQFYRLATIQTGLDDVGREEC